MLGLGAGGKAARSLDLHSRNRATFQRDINTVHDKKITVRRIIIVIMVIVKIIAIITLRLVRITIMMRIMIVLPHRDLLTNEPSAPNASVSGLCLSGEVMRAHIRVHTYMHTCIHTYYVCVYIYIYVYGCVYM